MALYFCVRIRVHGDATQRLGALDSSRSNLQKFSCLKRKAKRGVGEVAKKMKENFGVAFALPHLQKLFTNPFQKVGVCSELSPVWRQPEARRVYRVSGNFIHAHTPLPRIGRSLRSRGLLGGGVFALVASLEFVVFKGSRFARTKVYVSYPPNPCATPRSFAPCFLKEKPPRRSKRPFVAVRTSLLCRLQIRSWEWLPCQFLATFSQSGCSAWATFR